MNTLRNRFLFTTALVRAAATEGNGPAISFVIPTDCEGWKAGDTLTDAADIVAYWRALYAEMNEKEETLEDLSDDEVLSLSSSVEPDLKEDGTFADADEYVMEVCEALEEGGESAPLAEDLAGVMGKIASNSEVTDWINQVITAHKIVDSGAMHIAAAMLATLSRDEIAIMPWPGSKVAIGNRPFDILETQVPKKSGGTKPKSESKIKAMVASHPIIVALESQVAKVEESLGPGKLSESPSHQEKVKNLNKQIANASRAIRQAIALTILKDHFNDHKLIEMAFKKNTDGALVKETYCIHVDNRVNKREQTTVTVHAVTRCKFEQVKPTTGWATFLTLMERKRKTKTATTTYAMPNGIPQVADLLSTVNHAIAPSGFYGALQVASAITAGPEKEQADDILANLYEIEEYVNQLLDRPGMRQRAKAVIQSRLDEKDKAAQERLEKARNKAA